MSSPLHQIKCIYEMIMNPRFYLTGTAFVLDHCPVAILQGGNIVLDEVFRRRVASEIRGAGNRVTTGLATHSLDTNLNVALTIKTSPLIGNLAIGHDLPTNVVPALRRRHQNSSCSRPQLCRCSKVRKRWTPTCLPKSRSPRRRTLGTGGLEGR